MTEDAEKQSHRASRTFQDNLAKKDCISRIDRHKPVVETCDE